MTPINNCRGMTLEIVQRSKVPNDAWQNLELHYRVKGTREILILSLEVNEKTMQPWEDPFQIMMETDRLAADLHRLGDISITELKKSGIIVVGLFANYEIEVRVLEDNPTGLEMAEIEGAVGNPFSSSSRTQRLYFHRKAPPRRIAERTGDPATDSRATSSSAEGRVAALRTAEARRRSTNQEMPPPTRRAEVGESAASVEERIILRLNTVTCANAWSTGLAIVRSGELRRLRCWPK